MYLRDLKILKDKLPTYPGVLGRERYFCSAVLITLVLIDGEYNFLFQIRASNIKQEGEISFPGGKHDPNTDSDFSQTAIRETMEELGIAKEKIEIIGRLDIFIAPMGVLIEPFIGCLNISNLSELNINRKEVEDVFLLPVSFFENNPPKEYKARVIVEPSYFENGKEIILLPVKKLGLPEIYNKPWGGTIHRIFVYETKKGPIWGITAELIYAFVSLLKITKTSGEVLHNKNY